MFDTIPYRKVSGFMAMSALALFVGGCGGGGTSSGGATMSRATVSGYVQDFRTAWLEFQREKENTSLVAALTDWLLSPAQAGLSGVTVTLTCSASPQQSMVTGADGYFLFTGITPGDTCTLDFAYGGSSASMNIAVKAGENRHDVSIAGGRVVEVAVSSNGTIRGEVEDSVASSDHSHDDHSNDHSSDDHSSDHRSGDDSASHHSSYYDGHDSKYHEYYDDDHEYHEYHLSKRKKA